MLILPTHPRSALLMCFWLVVSILSGVLFGAFAALLGSSQWLGIGIPFVLVLLLLGLLSPQMVSALYNVWNQLTRLYCRAMRVWLKGISFYVIFAATGRVGSSLRLNRPASNQSGWLPRKTIAPTYYRHQYHVTTQDRLAKGWLREYLSWAVRSGNWWPMGLLVFLVLLAVLETEEEMNFSSNIYTLF